MLVKLVGLMIIYLLLLFIGYIGGCLVGGECGGVVGVIIIMGVIVGVDMLMFFGLMIVGLLGGYCIKKFDSWVDGKIKFGFEMLVNNFFVGIIGMIFVILVFFGIGLVVEVLFKILVVGVNFMVVYDMLLLVFIFVELVKILFFNNVINYGIFLLLGIQQFYEMGKFIFFLIEVNLGLGMGVLLVYMFFGCGSVKQFVGGVVIIYFLGGIYEIYFLYVLMNLCLILVVIFGGMIGVFILIILNGGLVFLVFSGLILVVLVMMLKGVYFVNIVVIVVVMVVFFVVFVILLKISKVKEEDDIEVVICCMYDMKVEFKGVFLLVVGDVINDLSYVCKIIVVCDVGMGFSVMGVGVLCKKVQDVGLSQIFVINSVINNLLLDVDLVIIYCDFIECVMCQVLQVQYILLINFLDSGLYISLIECLVVVQCYNINEEKVCDYLKDSFEEGDNNLFKLGVENIFLGCKVVNKEEVICFVGE